MAELKRQEKLLKRAKPLLDDKLKAKQRIRGLQSFLERVFTITSKDAQNLFEILDLIQKAMKYLHEKINTGWNQLYICSIIEGLLYEQNHEKLRRYGLKLLIQYLEMKTEVDETSASLIGLLVNADEIEVKQNGDAFNDCIGEDEQGLITKRKDDWRYTPVKRTRQEKRIFKLPSIENMSPADDNLFAVVSKEPNEKFTSADMIADLEYKASHLGPVLDSPLSLPLRNIWELFKSRILTRFFPAVSRRLGLAVPEDAVEYCPESILNSLLQFVFKVSATTIQISEHSPVTDVALSLLQLLLLENEENREMIHEMSRQSFILGKFHTTTNLFASWLAVPQEDLHSFLKEKRGKSKEGIDSPVIVHSADCCTNIMLRRYIRYFRLSILHIDVEKEDFVSNFKEVLNFFKFVGYERYHMLESATWNVLMNLLIDIQMQIFRNSNPQYEVEKMLAETIFCTWIRSRNFSEQTWKKLESYISRVKESKGVMKVWTEIMNSLTTIMCEKVYGISNLATLMKEDPSKRKRVGKAKGEHPGTPINRNLNNLEDNVRNIVANFEKGSDDGGLDLSPMANITGDSALFVQLNEIKWWDTSSILFLWKNILTCIGRLHEIKVKCTLPLSHPKVPSLFDFVGIIFKAADMPSSIAVAAGCVCRIMCRRHDQPEFSQWLPSFYKLLLKHLALPMDETLLEDVPDVVLRSVFAILGSLLTYEKHYHNALPEVQFEDRDNIVYAPPADSCPPHSIVNLKFGLFTVLQKFLIKQQQLKNYDYCEMILSLFGIFLFEETKSAQKSSHKLKHDILNVLLDSISTKNYKAANAAAIGISLIGECHESFESETIMQIIDRVVWGISEHLQYDDRRRKLSDVITCVSIVSNLLKTLLDLLMSFPSNIVSNPNISLRISEVIEETIHHATIGMDPNSSENSDLTEAELNEESAINVLIHLTHHLDNFSPMHGAAVINSDLIEPVGEEEENTQYLSTKSGTITTLIDMPAGIHKIYQENKVRLIIRNAAGKFAWDMKSFYHNIDEVEGEHKCSISPTALPKRSAESSKVDNNSSLSSFSSFANGGDMLESLLIRIAKNNPECIYPDPPNLDPEFHKLIMKHVEQEYLSQEQDVRLSQIRKSIGKREGLDQQTETAAVFEKARLLLAHFGQLNFDHLKSADIHLLTKSVNLTRDLRGLDRKFSREVAKFAIIYVGPDQEDEMSIFKNETGSVEYDEFVLSLGWEVNLAEHLGYAGGLDSNLVKDGICTYYCNSMIEMVFHDVTKMRIDKEDLKQLKKKRHIGNDHVQIVWSENRRDYKYDTIGGDFGNAQIIITPLPNALYAIDTYRDEQVQCFGPLQSRNVVTKECLGPLVRKTAINAYRSALSVDVTPGMETHPFTLRKQTISLISSRHKSNPNTYEKFITSILVNEHSMAEEAQAV
ncbi:Ral GTPase-activating protein subunit alpha-2 [Terramyces sp. JEL0728]|nr:Ral GTPase-activating protein subunit alpha-2 [Terramyces sp. JEL0728]